MSDPSASASPENATEQRALAFLRLDDVGDDPMRSQSSWPGPGAEVGEFVLEREIGRGGAGVVYRAVQKSLERRVALKLVPHGPGACTDAFTRRLEREGRMLASLRHEAILGVHAAGVVPGFHFVAMDLVDGATLRDLLAGHDLGLPRPGSGTWLGFAIEMLRKLASALGAAHSQGIVHRDVKPANVLVDRAGSPFLADFGLARTTEPTEATITTGFVGTAMYASPEQVRGEPLDARSDVFSFGALAFEAITGTLPFVAQTTPALVERIQFAEPRWPRSRRCPPDLRAIVDKCLEKRPADRYADGRGIEQDLERVLRFEPVRAVARGPFSRAWRRIARRPARSAVAGGVVALVAVAVILLALLGTRDASIQALEATASLGKAVALFQRGDVDEAERELSDLVVRDAAHAGPPGRLGDLHVSRREWARAREDYSTAIARSSGKPALADDLGLVLAEASIRGDGTAVDLPDASRADTARDFAQLALVHELRDDVPAALDSIDRAVSLEPDFVEWRLRRARFLSRLGRRRDCIEEIDLLRHKRPDDRALALWMTKEVFALGRLKEHEALLRGELRYAPTDGVLWADLSVTLRTRLRREEATECARKAMEFAPNDPRVISVAVFNLMTERRYVEARALLEPALVARPGDPNLVQRLAYLESAEGHVARAMNLASELEAIGRTDPSWRVAALELQGAIQMNHGSFAEAIATFQKLETIDPERPDWPFRLGRSLEKTQQFAEADAAFDRAIALDADRPEFLDGKARVLRANGKLWEALETYERSLGLDVDWAVTQYRIADVWYDLDEPRVALRYLQKPLDKYKDWMEAWALRAIAEQKIGDHEAALVAYAQALKLRPDPSVRADLAELLALVGREREAIEAYSQARTDAADLAKAWCGEGVVRLDAKDPEVRNPSEAVRLLEEAVKLEPDDAEYRALLERARAQVAQDRR